MKKLIDRAKLSVTPHKKLNNVRKIGIAIVATNAYFVLGVRLIKKFTQFYGGNDDITFYFFSDDDPRPYVRKGTKVKYTEETHSSWLDATNSKFKNILTLENEDLDYIFFMDADTSVDRTFTLDGVLGDLVGAEHFGNNAWMKHVKTYDRNPQSKAYISEDTELEQVYFHGAFFGGRKDKLIDFCKILRQWQVVDKEIPYEPIFNDESYINAYFHYNPPVVVPYNKFPFVCSSKGGLEDMRDANKQVDALKAMMLKHKEDFIDIRNSEVVVK
jgi:hypothetical protein